MPPVALAPAIAAVGSFLAAPIIGSLTVGGLLSTVALSAGSFLLNKAFAPKVKGLAGSGIDEGQKFTQQAATYPFHFLYGITLVGGRVFFKECKPPFFYLGLEIASHEIEGVIESRINGVKVSFDSNGAASSENFVNGTTPLVFISIRKGSATQAMDPILAADFPEIAADVEWRQRGHATVVLKCDYATDAATHEKFWGLAEPRFQFLVRGMKVFDPNDPTQSAETPATWKWSDTASLCLAHFLSHPQAGNVAFSQIDAAVLAQASRDDAQSISLANGGVEKRYTINGLVDLSSDLNETVQSMLAANLGRLVWSAGTYLIYSGVPRPAVWTLNDDSARGDMEISNERARRDLVNVVRTVFVAPDREYQTANGPVLENATYITADGQRHEITLALPFTASHTTAQRIGKSVMEKSRKGKTIARRESLEAIRLNAADVVNIEVNFLPVLGGVFELNALKLDHDTFEIDIEAEEYDAAMFDWSPADEQPFEIDPAELDGVN